MELDEILLLCVPEQVVRDLGKGLRGAASGLDEWDRGDAVLGAEHFVEHDSEAMDILAADLDEEAAGIVQQRPGQGGVAADVVEVGMDAVLVGVPERLHADGVVRDVLRGSPHAAVLHRRLEVAVELDAVGRVVEDHLHLPGQAVALGEGGHDAAGVAPDEAVLPVAPVFVPLVGGALGQVVVGGAEEVPGLPAVGGRRGQGADEGGRVDLLVDVERVGVDGQVVRVLAPVPGEARLAVFVLPERRFVAVGRPVLRRHERRGLLGGQVQPVGGGMRVGLRRRLAPRGLLLRHSFSFRSRSQEASRREIAASRSSRTESGRVKMQ